MDIVPEHEIGRGVKFEDDGDGK
jgi:MFS family permease